MERFGFEEQNVLRVSWVSSREFLFHYELWPSKEHEHERGMAYPLFFLFLLFVLTQLLAIKDLG